MENQEPEALRLAEWCDSNSSGIYRQSAEAAKELRRLHARVQELEAMLDAVGAGGVSAQRVTQGKDHVAQPLEMVAAPVVLPEPEAYLFQHEDTGQTMFVEAQQVEWGFEANNPRLQKISGVYTEEQVRELLDKATCTKSQTAQEPFGYFKAEPFGWRDCAETDEGAVALYEVPQPQADARDVGRYLDYLIRNQARVRNNLDEYEGDEDCADCGYWLEFTDSNSQRWVQIGVFKTPRGAIDAAIAAAKETQ